MARKGARNRKPKVPSAPERTRSGEKLTKPRHASSEQSRLGPASWSPKRERRAMAMAKAKLQALTEKSNQTAAVNQAENENSNNQAPAPETQSDTLEPPADLEDTVASSAQPVASTKRIPPVQPNSPQFPTEAGQSPIEIGQFSVPKPHIRQMSVNSPFREFSSVEDDIRWNHGAFDDVESDGNLNNGGVWKYLRAEIDGFVINILPPSCNWKSLDNNTQAALTALCPKAAMFVAMNCRTDHHARKLFSAWIWRIIYDNLLSADCVDKWAGPEWKAFGTIQRALRGGLEHIDPIADNPFDMACFNTRHYLARMLYVRCGQHADPDRLAKIITKETASLRQIQDDLIKERPPVECSDSDSGSDVGESQYGFEPSLSRVVEAAIRVDFLLVSSFQRITVEMHDPETGLTSGFPSRRPLMKEMSFSGCRSTKFYQGRPVDFICEPLVRTYGKETFYINPPEDWKGNPMAFPLKCGYGGEFPNFKCQMQVVVDQFPEDETGSEAERLEGSLKLVK